MSHAAPNGGRRALARSLRLAAIAAAVLSRSPPAAGADPSAIPTSTSTSTSGAPAPFVMSSDVGVPIVAYFTRVYTEAFRRMGVPLRFDEHALSRRTALAEEGAIDGEMARIRTFGDTHPRLIRVEEPIFDFGFALFSANPEIQIARLDDLAGARWTVEYRRGIMLCQRELERRVPREQLSDVPTPEQGIRKLLAGRTDLYCDLDDYVVQAKLRTAEFRGETKVRRVLRFATLPTYPYVSDKHPALARRLGEVLRQLRDEGFLDRTLREVRAASERE